MSSMLLSPNQLASKAGNVKIIDATWYMPGTPKDPAQEFLDGPRIKGALGFWDVDKIAGTHPLGLPHMMPDEKMFAEACSQLGIERDSEIVVYDKHGLMTAPRTAFTFKAFGHDNVYVLNGGLPRWKAEGYEVDETPFKASQSTSHYESGRLAQERIRSYAQIISNNKLDQSDANAELVLDARARGRFTGEAPEPRAGMSSGHMPNAISLPFPTLLTPPSKTDPPYQMLLPPDELKKVLLSALNGNEKLLEAILSGKKQVVSSCGSGMTAAVIWLALHELGVQSGIYDESWMGYASRKESPIIKDV